MWDTEPLDRMAWLPRLEEQRQKSGNFLKDLWKDLLRRAPAADESSGAGGFHLAWQPISSFRGWQIPFWGFVSHQLQISVGDEISTIVG